MSYLYLAIAIIAEVIATSALKASEEFTHWLPSSIVLVGYSASFYFMMLTLRELPIGITYALWSGIGIVLVTWVGAFYFQQKLDAPAIIGIAFIVTGVVIIQCYSSMVPHSD